jgi:hypothetical protein
MSSPDEYEIINDDSNNTTYVAIKNALESTVDPKGLLVLIAETTRDDRSLTARLNQLRININKITTVKKTDGGGTKTDIIKDNTQVDEIKKIHFLAASIYQGLVLACLSELKKANPQWDNIVKIIKANLNLVPEGAALLPGLEYFYINPLNLSAGTSETNVDKILMYQLLLKLIANNLNPDILDVIVFLLKINNSWCGDAASNLIVAELKALANKPTEDAHVSEFYTDGTFAKLESIVTNLSGIQLPDGSDIKIN